MKRCMYCNKTNQTPHPVTIEGMTCVCCSSECAEKTADFARFAKKNTVRFLIGVLVCPLVLMLGSIFPLSLGYSTIGSMLFCAGWAAVGVTMIVFPFATPQTSQLMGIRKSTVLVRVIGIALLIMTPLFWFLVSQGA